MNSTANITEVTLRHYPETQAIYLFGSFGTEQEWPDSDVDQERAGVLAEGLRSGSFHKL